MEFSRRLFLLSFFFLCFNWSTIAQVNSLSGQNLATVNIDEVSDQEIKTYYFKALENGLSEQDIYRILSEKGLPQGELSKLSDRMITIKGEPAGTTTKKNISSESENIDRSANMDASKIPLEKTEKDLTIFGSEIFSTSSLVFEPNLRIPTPAGYLLGPDDELLINVFGYSEKTYTVAVNEEGNIYIPQVGPMYLNGLSIEEATLKIRSKLASTIYKAINTGQTNVQIRLGKIRSIRVTVIGEANKPGTLTVSSLTTLFNLLYLCGGPTDYGTYRKIELIRGNEIKRTIDLYSFLLKGDQKDNVLLRDGDVIRIPYYTTRVMLNGNVKRKGKYELIDGETFEQVLQFSGGFADNAYKAAITVYQLTDTERKIIDVSKNQFINYQPLSSDSIVVGQLLNRFTNKLTISGAVNRPGNFELIEDMNLKQLIEKAGGVKEEVYNKRGSISRLNDSNMPIQLSFNIDAVLRGQSDIRLQKNDAVMVYSIFDFKVADEITIDGFINKPGKYKWAENITLQDVILLAGGFAESGDNKNIEIARRINDVNLREANHFQTEIITVDLSDNVNTKDILLKPLDVINIRQQSAYTNPRTVFVEGSVINPGRYTLIMSGDRLSQVMKRTGGFRAYADTTGVIIRRLVRKNRTLEERERLFSKLSILKDDSLSNTTAVRKEIFKDYENISIDLSKAINSPSSPENMLLEDGDVITIERNTNLVKVSGEVYLPNTIPFKKNENLKYYIEKSGSYTPDARKRGALVIYPDGKAKQVKHFLFFKSYPEVVSRSEIFVPQKTERNRSKISIGEWSVVLSSLAIIANIIINVSK